jgi:hypothetical protein
MGTWCMYRRFMRDAAGVECGDYGTANETMSIAFCVGLAG